MTRPRHRAQRRPWVTILIAGIAAGLILVIGMAGYRPRAATPTTPATLPTLPTPQPTATWTSYVPTTPIVCRDAMDTADEAIKQAEDRYESTLKAAQLGNDGKPGGAEKQIKIAQEAHENLTKTVQAYIKKAKECRK